MNPDLKTFEITYSLPSSLENEQDENELGARKSLNFHRFMRHARECHKNLLGFLIQHSLLSGAGESSLIANERKTILSCTEEVLARIRALPFVERAEEKVASAQRQVERFSKAPTNGGRAA